MLDVNFSEYFSRFCEKGEAVGRKHLFRIWLLSVCKPVKIAPVAA